MSLPPAAPRPTLILDGQSLTLEGLAPLLAGQRPRLVLTERAKEAMGASRRQVERTVESGAVVYGLTTGFGRLKSVAIARGDLAALQQNLVLSHCCGVGEPMADAEVLAMLILRLNGLARGHSGVRVELVERWIELYEAGFLPIVPRQGSVGASGDLAPLAHLAAAFLGHGEAKLAGRRMPAAEALRRLGQRPLALEAKEGLALINGTEAIKAVGGLALLRAKNLIQAADAIGALSLEALLGSLTPFDPRLAELKGHAGHRRTAANFRALLAHSAVLASHADCDRVQDPYCLRCIPQIHGAVKAAYEHVSAIVAGELNAVTDNPVLFPEQDEVLSAGLFHGQPLSIPLDYLGLALCTLANVSERRIEQLVNPDLSRLPAFLTPRPGLNSGLMIAQVAAAALASENKVHAHPASVDTVPTSANQEDHVSMGMTAARKLVTIVENVERVLGIEYLCAGQAREFHSELVSGVGPRALEALLRTRVAPLGEDRFLHPDLVAAGELVASGAVVRCAEAALGASLLS
jgi:histidine ammonia-lyase